jgi:hypothetical protein
MPLPGVFIAKKKDGTTYYRSSLTFHNKHISLGSFKTEKLANQAYLTANNLLNKKKKPHTLLDIPHVEQYQKLHTYLSFDKWIMLLNLRDNMIYCNNPIYLRQNYFLYYVSETLILKFDTDDLFYYMKHRIMQRGGHLFVSDYGMQVNILSRYGIKNFAVPGKDYRFVNGDTSDFRYGNILIINHYHGVFKTVVKGRDVYTAKLHIRGDYIIGRYATEYEAAIAYNKAAAYVKSKGLKKDFPENYIESIDDITYAKLYNSVRISKKIREYSK